MSQTTMIAMLEEAEDVLRRAGCDVTADKVRGVLQAQQAEPRFACGDSFTSDAVCANCLAAQQQAEPVAAQCRFEGEEEWSPCTLAHHLLVQAHPKEWPHYETRALCAQPPAVAVPEGYALVPVEPTEEQWGGLARDIMMAFDLGGKSPASLLKNMRLKWGELPEWMRKELNDPESNAVLSKGTRAVLIYRAMLAAAPQAVATGWIDPNDKTQKQYLPHIGEPVLFCHDGVTYYGQHTGGSFETANGFAVKFFETWDCLWMYPPAAAQKGGA